MQKMRFFFYISQGPVAGRGGPEPPGDRKAVRALRDENALGKGKTRFFNLIIS